MPIVHEEIMTWLGAVTQNSDEASSSEDLQRLMCYPRGETECGPIVVAYAVGRCARSSVVAHPGRSALVP